MPEIFQNPIAHRPSILSTGEVDFHPGGWSKQDWVAVGGDFTGVTCIPNQAHASPPYVDTTHTFIRSVQDDPDEDISEDLARNLAAAFTDAGAVFGPFLWNVGVITGAWIVARSVDGEEITAQWYVAGEAVGSQIAFDNEDHKTIRLPNFFYGIENWIRREPLTLRLWGGETRTSGMLFLPRPTQSYNAVDIIDPNATIDSVISDPLSTSGGDVVLATPTGTISLSFAEELLLITADAEIEQQSLDLLYVERAGPPLTTDTARYKNFSPYVSGDTTSSDNDMGTEIWVNDIQISNEPEWSGIAPQGAVPYTVWQPTFHNMFNGIRGGDPSLEWPQTPIIVQEDDEIEIRIWTFDGATTRAFDQVHIGRRIDVMQLVYDEEPADIYACSGDSFDLEWTYTGPTTQDISITVDRSSLFTDLDGLIYDTTGTIVHQELGITSPWTVDLSNFDGNTGTFYAIIRGTLDDGSYAYTGWQFDIDCGFGQIYRRL